ncbi:MULTISPECIES: hypothetical protein [Actinoplanes]|nr:MULTISPECIES: hypothetical protein [Actinoplanes]GIE73261.1 hypothetical protein Apa02nite_093690 [Actinoplanes palleronii]
MTRIAAPAAALQSARKFVVELPAHQGPASFTVVNPIAPDVDMTATTFGPGGGWVSGGFVPGPEELRISFDTDGGPYRLVLIG